MAKVEIVEKLILKLKEIQDETLSMAKLAEAPSGSTSGATSGSTSNLPSVLVDEIQQPNIKISYSAIGAPVLMLDAKGKEQSVLDGEYKLATGKLLVVEGGKLKDIKDLPAEESSGTTEQSGDTKMSKAVIEPAELTMAQSTGKAVQTALSRSGLDISKKGSYCLNFEIGEDGEMTCGTLATNTYQNLVMAKEQEIQVAVDAKVKEIEVAMAKQKENYEKVVKTLNTNVKTIDTNPQVETQEVLLSKTPTKTEILKAEIANKKNK